MLFAVVLAFGSVVPVVAVSIGEVEALNHWAYRFAPSDERSLSVTSKLTANKELSAEGVDEVWYW